MDPPESILVVTAVRAESRAVLAALIGPVRASIGGRPGWVGRAGERRVTVMQVGIGPARARAALAAITDPYDLVVSTGFAGALVDGMSPGDVVLPDRVVWEAGGDPTDYAIPSALHETALAALSSLVAPLRGTLYSSPSVIATPAAKRALAGRTGAVAVEMEAAALIEVARERGASVLALRTILDSVDFSLDRLPADLESSWGARARLLARPAAWPSVAALARHVPRASRALTRAAKDVLATVTARQ